MIRLDMPAPFPKKYLVRHRGQTVRQLESMEDALQFALECIPKDDSFKIVEIITYNCKHRVVPDPSPEDCDSKHERRAREILTTLRKVKSRSTPR